MATYLPRGRSNKWVCGGLHTRFEWVQLGRSQLDGCCLVHEKAQPVCKSFLEGRGQGNRQECGSKTQRLIIPSSYSRFLPCSLCQCLSSQDGERDRERDSLWSCGTPTNRPTWKSLIAESSASRRAQSVDSASGSKMRLV